MSSVGLYCSYCGQLNDADAVFCARCGARQKPISDASGQGEPVSPTPAPALSAAPIEPASGYAPAVTPGESSGYPAPPAYDYTPAPVFHGYGGFWIRVLAAIIDSAAIGVVVYPLMFMVMAVAGLAGANSRVPEQGLGLAVMMLIFPLAVGAGWLYSAGLESSKYQGTLGKMALGLKVTDLYGNRISFGRATGRHFAKIISGMILYVGFIMVGFTERKQGLHDMLVSTVVLKK
jgi:uncharacterized RDD family membrane protein YckC